MTQDVYNALSDAEKADYDGKAPACFIDYADGEDDGDAPADCCRVYELNNYTGRYMEFCLDSGETKRNYKLANLSFEHEVEGQHT